MQFDGFDWDDGNRSKCLKHGVPASEIEFLFQGEPRVGPDIGHSSREQRFRAVGKTAQGRALFVIFTWREGSGPSRLIRPISARDMDQREIHSYEKGVS